MRPSTWSAIRREVAQETPTTSTRLPTARRELMTWMKSESPETRTKVLMLGKLWAVSMQSAVILTSTLFLTLTVRPD